MLRKTIEIKLPANREATPVAMLVQIASQFESSIYLEAEGKKVNAKSIMGMMSLALNDGEAVTLSCSGADEAEAGKKLEHYLLGNVSS